MASYPPFQEDITAQAGQVNNPAWRQFFVRLGTLLAGTASNVSTYILASADATLLNSRVLTGSVSNTVNNSTPGQVTIERAALTGDVTANANANATTIAANAVTYAKMQDVSAASRLIGRGSAAGAGDPQEITLSGLSMVGTVLTGTGGSVTNTGTLAANQLIIGNGGVDVTALGAPGTTTTVLHGNAAGAPTFGAVNVATDVTGTLPGGNGGTGLSVYTVGDLIYASTVTDFSRLSSVSAGSYVRSAGVGTAPVWSTLKLPNAASQGDIVYASAADSLVVLAKDTNSSRYLSNTGGSNNPAWAQVDLGNGVTGTLPVGNGGTGVTSLSASNWTPALTFGGGSTGLTYSSQVGKYVRIGQLVVLTGLIVLTAKGSSAGAAVISGLPYTIGDGSSNGWYSSNKVSYSAFTAGVQEVGLQTVPNTTTMIPVKSVTGTNTQLTDADFGNTSQLVVYLVYFVA